MKYLDEKEEAKLKLKILEDEYLAPNFGISWKDFYVGLLIVIVRIIIGIIID